MAYDAEIVGFHLEVDMTKVLPIHSGEHLAELLEKYGVTQYRLAKAIHSDVSQCLSCSKKLA